MSAFIRVVWIVVKKDITEPLIYSVILAALLGVRMWWREQERRRQAGIPRCRHSPELKSVDFPAPFTPANTM